MGGLAYLVRDGETGFTIPAEEPDTLCEKLSWLLNDPELHAKMSGQAAEYAQDYAWEKIAKQIVGVYEELVRPSSSRQKPLPSATRLDGSF